MTNLEIRAVKADELAQIATLIADVFAHHSRKYHQALRYYHAEHLPQHPSFNRDDYRVAFMRGVPVALARVARHTLRYGKVNLKVAGIGDICTHPNFRHRGYSEIVVRDALAYATEAGAHLVLLRDPGAYYPRYGFSPVLPDYTLHFRADHVMKVPAPDSVTLRRAHHNDLAALDYLYEQHWSGRVAFSRSPSLWKWRLDDEQSGRTVLVCNLDDEIEGYLWRHAHDPQRIEIVANTPDAMLRLMQAVAMQTQQENIILPVPPDDAIVAYARLFLPVTLAARFHPESGWMARPVNARRLMRALLPELKHHLESIAYLSEAMTPVLEVRPEGIVVGLKDKPEMMVELNQRDFIQVMFGTLRPQMLAQRTPVRREHVRMLEMLFPPRMAALAAWDWF